MNLTFTPNSVQPGGSCVILFLVPGQKTHLQFNWRTPFRISIIVGEDGNLHSPLVE